LSKRLTPFIKSEPIPEKTDKAVTTVVAHNFEEIVLDTTKDVLLEMYAPWCGHCKKLDPIYEELAQKIKKNKNTNMVIAKIDATANDSPHAKYVAKGYPTILFAPANNKGNPIPFSGERDINSMYSWLRSHASLPWTTKEDL